MSVCVKVGANVNSYAALLSGFELDIGGGWRPGCDHGIQLHPVSPQI